MKDGKYGGVMQAEIQGQAAYHAEELTLQGFTCIEGVINQHALADWRDRIDTIYAAQENALGRDQLCRIGDQDLCRAPLLYDDTFLSLAANPTVLNIVRRLLGEFVTLHLQNGIISRPGIRHYQSSWHRDLPYQNFVISRPLAISALFALDAFSSETGGTMLLPFSQKMEVMPSPAYVERHSQTASMGAGGVLLFDSMLFHRAGFNRSTALRRGINHVYSIPIIKQQYDFPRHFHHRADFDPQLRQLLGFTSAVALDDYTWRQARLDRLAHEPNT